MATISFTQSTTANGQIALALSSTDLPAGSFTFSLVFNYTGANVQFNSASYSGSSSTTLNSDYAGSVGSVKITGSLFPASSQPFATFLFDANGKGSFNADITSLQINGSAQSYTDPAAYNFSIIAAPGEIVALQADGSASGTYNPLDSFFSPTYTLKTAAQHGSVVFGDSINPSAWKYTPAAGFYGTDTFTLKVADVFDSKEKTLTVNVSPVGTANNDTFHSSAGSYHTDGGSGLDTLSYTGKMADFSVALSGASAIVTDKTGTEGVNYLEHFERLTFSDGAIALDINGNGGQAYRLYQAAFHRTPDAGGLGFWMNALDKGASLIDAAKGFMTSKEFLAAYGAAPTNEQLVNKFYENILNRAPEKSGFDFWVGLLNNHTSTAAEVLAQISESAENQAAMATIIGQGFAYTPYVG
ncbi:DUF4214 domain-containing protein [Pseudoduganella sp. FT55W]|uniref:DUF4214 domain-containing protein n=1 Tax=Duganella rivi TaxID=2666083 RepID=A0A7X4KDI7_9BURK|nr:DUF4214 domain-containing protein [Duganella rivi]MYM70311.1 DUF4214 domain-containing protein [Duganella rivi]